MGISTVVVVGLGYIGLPTAAILAANDVDVIGVDINPATVEAVNAGRVPFVEPDLSALLAGAVGQGHLRAVGIPEPADVFIVAVPTPFTEEHKPDLSYIRAAASSIAPLLTGGELVVLESTSPPGATQQLADWIIDLRPDLSLDPAGDAPAVHFAHCPERVLPGRILVEIVENDRVIGGLTPEAAESARELYSVFCRGEILLTDAKTAEMTKLVENAYRDVNIAFANELSIIAESLGVDVWELISLANRHPRVGILKPGPGVGGHCIAVDPWFLVDVAPSQASLIRSARTVNDLKPEWVVGRVTAEAEKSSPREIALLGLAFKPDIDDVRQSPARKIAAWLADRLPETPIIVVEPNVNVLPVELAGRANISLGSLDEARTADLVVELVAHSQFVDLPAELDPEAEFITFARAARAA